MPGPGYVYALINWSMPGLVKVGITSRAPDDRLNELSSATGIPTPFVPVIAVLVADAEATERLVHTRLEELGYRVSDGREFFRAPVHEVVQLLLAARDHSAASGLAVAPPRARPKVTGSDKKAAALLRTAAEICIQADGASTSLIQRRLKVGYSSAARIVDQLEDAGILGAADGPRGRAILITLDDLDALLPG